MIFGRMNRLVLGLLAGVLGGVACADPEVVSAPSDQLVVVEAVLAHGRPKQSILAHTSVSDRRSLGVPGLDIRVTSERGDEVRFVEAPHGGCAYISDDYSLGDRPFIVEPTCYIDDEDSPWVEPGMTYHLRVETPDGGVLQGNTTVPTSPRFRLPEAPTGVGERCNIPPDTVVPLSWSRSPGAWGYVSVLEVRGFDMSPSERWHSIEAAAGLESVNLTAFSFSDADTTLSLTRSYNVAEGLEYDRTILDAMAVGIPEGTAATVMVSAMDRNLWLALHGSGFNPSGHARIPSVSGAGTGFFGSYAGHALHVSVLAGPYGCPRP